MYSYAEVSQKNMAVLGVLHNAPFVPEFAPNIQIICIDITNADETPEIGWIYDPDTGDFSEPEPEKDPYLGELVLDTELTDNSNLDLTIGQRVTVTGKIEKDGQLIPIDFERLRIPILPTDLEGNPLPAMQPSMAVAKIEAGLVTATWIPEFTGTYAITERGLNVRLPKGFWLRFRGLLIFVLPQETT